MLVCLRGYQKELTRSNPRPFSIDSDTLLGNGSNVKSILHS